MFQPLLRSPENENDTVTIENHCIRLLQQGDLPKRWRYRQWLLFCMSHFTYTLNLHHIPHGYGIDTILQYHQTMHIPI